MAADMAIPPPEDQKTTVMTLDKVSMKVGDDMRLVCSKYEPSHHQIRL